MGTKKVARRAQVIKARAQARDNVGLQIDADIVDAVREQTSIGGRLTGSVVGIRNQVNAALTALEDSSGRLQAFSILSAVSLQLRMLSLILGEQEHIRELKGTLT